MKHCYFFSLQEVLFTLYFLLISEFLNVRRIGLGFFVHLYKTSNLVMRIYYIYERDASNTWPRYPILTRGNFLPLSFGILNDILEFLSEFVEVTDVDLIEYQLLVLWPTLRCLSVSSKLMPIRMNINNNTLNYYVNYFNIWISNGRKIYINIWG